jgi:hypothetical protein
MMKMINKEKNLNLVNHLMVNLVMLSLIKMNYIKLLHVVKELQLKEFLEMLMLKKYNFRKQYATIIYKKYF